MNILNKKNIEVYEKTSKRRVSSFICDEVHVTDLQISFLVGGKITAFYSPKECYYTEKEIV